MENKKLTTKEKFNKHLENRFLNLEASRKYYIEKAERQKYLYLSYSVAAEKDLTALELTNNTELYYQFIKDEIAESKRWIKHEKKSIIEYKGRIITASENLADQSDQLKELKKAKADFEADWKNAALILQEGKK